ncbi:MAG: uL15m family ribosomal protein [Patescibacteria group bacterium]
MELHTLTRTKSNKATRRVGRGGKRGKTSGRGSKGQKSRAGAKFRPEWRDIIKKIPKRRGYGRNRSRTAVPRIRFATVNFDTLSRQFKAGDIITPIALVKAGAVRRISGKVPPIKILARGEISMKLAFEDVLISEVAKTLIEKAGGTVRAPISKKVLPSKKDTSPKKAASSLKAKS